MMKLIKNLSPKAFWKYWNNTVWLFAGRFATMVVAFVTSVLVIRYLGPTDYGALSYAKSFIVLFTPVISFGLNVILTRELLKRPHQQNELLGSSLLLSFFGLLLFFILIGVGNSIVPSSGTIRKLLGVIAFAQMFKLFFLWESYFQAKVQSKYISLAHFGGGAASAIFQIFFIIIKAPIIYFAIAYFIEVAVTAALFVIIYAQQGNSLFSIRHRWPILKDLFLNSWPILIAGVATTVYFQIDQVMIKLFLGLSETGIYAAGTKFCSAWYFIPKLISQSLFPAIVKSKEISQEKYLNRIQEFFDLIVLIGFGLTFLFAPFGTLISRTLFGVDFLDAGKVISIYMWSGIFVFIGVVSYRYFLIENFQKYLLFRSVAGAIINILLNLIFIPRWGIHGAAYATVITYFIVYYFMNIFFAFTFPVFVMQTKSLSGYSILRRVMIFKRK